MILRDCIVETQSRAPWEWIERLPRRRHVAAQEMLGGRSEAGRDALERSITSTASNW